MKENFFCLYIIFLVVVFSSLFCWYFNKQAKKKSKSYYKKIKDVVDKELENKDYYDSIRLIRLPKSPESQD